MLDRNHTQRLDEILVAEGLVNDEQIKEALQYQKEHGGRFGSNLMSLGHVDEAGLVKALSKQTHCSGVILTGLEIPEIIIRLIPSKIAIARKLLPFDYDPGSNTLMVACEDPNNQNLRDEIKFVARGKNIRLFIAAELALDEALEKHYSASDEVIEDSGPIELNATEIAQNQSGGSPVKGVKSLRGWMLLVTNENDDIATLSRILEKENYGVVTIASADDAIGLLDDRVYDTVFIRDTVPGDYLDLIDRLRKISPSTRVRYYESAAGMLLADDAAAMHEDLLLKNYDIFTSLLVSKDKQQSNHGARVGEYVDRLCRRIGLPEKDRVLITSAGYLHDLARFYYGETELPEDPSEYVHLTAKLLESLNYSPLVVGVLRSMYINLGGKYTQRLPIESLGGNIVTAVDIYCDTIPDNEKLSLEAFEIIRVKLRELTGRLFLTEVADALIGLIHDEMLSRPKDPKFGQVQIYGVDEERSGAIQQRLKDEGFRPIADESMDFFVEHYMRGRPDMMVVLDNGEAGDATRMVDDMIARGIEFDQVPTFLLTGSSRTVTLTSMLEKGIEDIIPIDDNLNLLVAKMNRIRSAKEANASSSTRISNSSGARGSIRDMNLIDLLQALGPSRKTAKLTITSSGDKAVLYLDKGQIIYAKLGDLEGAEAVYRAMVWTDGEWETRAVEEADLPEPNNDRANESILMEGCRILDERERAKADDSEIEIQRF